MPYLINLVSWCFSKYKYKSDKNYQFEENQDESQSKRFNNHKTINSVIVPMGTTLPAKHGSVPNAGQTVPRVDYSTARAWSQGVTSPNGSASSGVSSLALPITTPWNTTGTLQPNGSGPVGAGSAVVSAGLVDQRLWELQQGGEGDAWWWREKPRASYKTRDSKTPGFTDSAAMAVFDDEYSY